MAQRLRFGLSLRDAGNGLVVRDRARWAEDMGYSVLHIRDHLGAPAPFPTLTAAAAATTTLHVGTFVLNAGFYRPALLARDAATLWELSAGRLELGLGAGAVREEFEAAGIPFPTPRERVDHLGRVVGYLREHVPDVPLLIGGNGDRVLTLAARQAQIVALRADPAEPDDHPLAERITFVRNAARERFCELELNLAITAMPVDDSGVPVVALTRRSASGPATEPQVRAPGVLSGSITDMADEVRRYRETYGVTYITVQQAHAESFAKVIAQLH